MAKSTTSTTSCDLFAKAHHSVVNGVDPGARSICDRLHDVVVVDETMATPPSKLFGPHNKQLIRLAITALRTAGVDVDAKADAIAEAIASFSPLPHRLEPVAEIDGVLYVNDSLSTNPIAATAAIRAFVGRPISLLLGGHDRGLSFDEFGAFVSSVPDLKVFTLPDCGPRIAATFADTVLVTPTSGLQEAITMAKAATPAGGVVLLAPAAASFGQFADYAARGEAFRTLVAALK